MTDPQTSALVRRNGDRRTRRVAIEVPRYSDRDLATAEKYYCPSCGQVRRVTPAWFLTPAIVEDRVMPHEFSTGSHEVEYCPGGTFDPEADAA